MQYGSPDINIRDKPVVRLRNLVSGKDAILVNMHNPANVRGTRPLPR